MNKHDSEESDEGVSLTKRSGKKSRRLRRKTYRPYYQLSEKERLIRDERELLREQKLNERMVAKGRITAPYNTTQFLMLDKCDNRSEDRLYSDSSMDSEEDFISREFRKDYEGEHVNRLERMSKEMLLSELLLAERRNERLEQRLETIQLREEKKAKHGEVDYEFYRVEVPMEPETALKIKVFQEEIEKLRGENQKLMKENAEMKENITSGEDIRDEMTSSSSDSSSESSSDSSSDDSDSESESDSHFEENEADVTYMSKDSWAYIKKKD